MKKLKATKKGGPKKTRVTSKKKASSKNAPLAFAAGHGGGSGGHGGSSGGGHGGSGGGGH